MPVIKAITATNVIAAFSGTPDGTKFLKDDGTLASAGGYTELVASGANGGTLTLYDDTATTGVSTFAVRAGAGQSTTDLAQVFLNDGTTKRLWVTSTGSLRGDCRAGVSSFSNGFDGNEIFGLGAYVGAAYDNCTVVGANAGADQHNAIAIGYNAYVDGNTAIGIGVSVYAGASGVAIGPSSSAANYNSFALGASSNADGLNSIAIGGSTTDSNNNYVIAIGSGLVATATNQGLFGNATSPITDWYYGGTPANTAGPTITMQPTVGNGTDKAGGDYRIAGGKGTGNAAPGDIFFATSTAGASSATVQTLTDRWSINGSTGVLGPIATNTYDFCSSSLRAKTIYACDLDIQDVTATTGVTSVLIKGGEGQEIGTTPALRFANNAGTTNATLGFYPTADNSVYYYGSHIRAGNPSSWSAGIESGTVTLGDAGMIKFSNSSQPWPAAASDVGIARLSAGNLRVTDGSTGYGGARAASMGFGADPVSSSAVKIKIAGSQTNALLLEGTGGIANPQIYWTDASAISGWLGFAGGDFSLGDGGAGAAINIDPTYPNAYIKSYTGSTGFLTLQSHNGSSYVDALYMGAGKAILSAQQIQGTHSKTLTDNTITDVVQISSATTDRVTAGHLAYTIYASDATTHLVQCETGKLPFLLVNENGTVTVTLGAVYGTANDNAGGAALSNTFASSVTGTNAKIRVTSDYDQATLTGTVTHAIEYRVHIDSGTATVTPQ